MMPTYASKQHTQQTISTMTYSNAGLWGKVTELAHTVDLKWLAGLSIVCAGPVLLWDTYWPRLKDCLGLFD